MNKTQLNYNRDLQKILLLLKAIENIAVFSPKKLQVLQKKFTKKDGGIFSKTEIIAVYKKLAGKHGLKPFQDKLVKQLKMKPTRTISGVAPVTVLTKPFPCPGHCIFCPSDIRMPKSYLSDEPGAQRAERNFFDPYLQTYNRIKALADMGHNTDKIELIILGGSWTYYPESYQIWFIKECFRALNDFGTRDDRERIKRIYHCKVKKLKQHQFKALTNDPELNLKEFYKYKTIDKNYNQLIEELYLLPEKKLGLDTFQQADWQDLEKEHQLNEQAKSRCVGLVIETRPDNISEEQVKRIRRLGCTKVQIGIQSLNDQVLSKNKRGHDVATSAKAFKLLRLAGFKIHAHWMANLHGSSVQLDKEDYLRLFSDLNFKPDELKIYPCSLIKSAELMTYYQQDLWRPYFYKELLDVLVFCLKNTPQYCRLTRVMRDIPSPDIVVGNKKTNFRQIAEQALAKTDESSQDIRAREIRAEKFSIEKLQFRDFKYKTSMSEERFLQFIAPVKKMKASQQEKLLAFLRLSLPNSSNFIDELAGAAMIREVHVYGPALSLGKKSKSKAQHLGLGSRLIVRAKQIARKAGYKKLAVISAIGTKEYYRKRGFKDGELYQLCDL
ncbi:MAG: tRNA uridine(34) 5-carboxymethylaminomethyl modification radical SAM/GNAT enzyme Elp3 [Candidatus Woesebacteria bacterium]|jgi:elongator complex protein 3